MIQNDNPKLGIITDDLNIAQKGYYLIQELNQVIKKRSNLPVCCFRGTITPLPLQPYFPLYPQKLCWTFHGALIATEIETAYKLLTCWRATQKLFYIWNLEWQYFQYVTWKELHHIYDNDDLDLIARSQAHADILTKIWKKPKYIMDNFNHKVLLEIVDNVYPRTNTINR